MFLERMHDPGMAWLAILLLSVGASIVFGIVHDMATAHLCVEYFTIGHPKVIESEDPVMLALTWGVLATWWVGAMGGLVLIWAARWGSWPKWGAAQLVKPMAICLAVMGGCATLAWFAGWMNARHFVTHFGWIEGRMAPEKYVPYYANYWAHMASYFAGGVGILLIAWHVRRQRQRAAARA